MQQTGTVPCIIESNPISAIRPDLSDAELGIVPAASTIVFRRASTGGPAELLLLVRSAEMRFGAGAAVFPGGRVDPADRKLALRLFPAAPDHDDLSARIAALRETLEEAGLAIGIDSPVTADQAAEARALLLREGALAPVLERFGWTLRLDRLEPFARWNPKRQKLFDTRFYLADLGTGAIDLQVDGTEHGELHWMSAAEALARDVRGELRIMFPTRCNLARLAQFDDYAAALADARAWPQPIITSWISEEDGQTWLNIPNDIGFPVYRTVLEQTVRD